MTLIPDDPNSSDMSAVARIARIANLFTSISCKLDDMIAAFSTENAVSPKTINLKLGELQSAHASLIRAEEVFHEKFASTDAASGINYDAIRDDIGRQLDRIRAAISPE